VAAAVATAPMLSAAPAHAIDPCWQEWYFTSTAASNSENFNASINCDGVWGLATTSYNDWIKGQYYTTSWVTSSYGWQWITVNQTYKKMIGNTVDGRRLRGFASSHSQDVWYAY
jgi:hypothetical protein